MKIIRQIYGGERGGPGRWYIKYYNHSGEIMYVEHITFSCEIPVVAGVTCYEVEGLELPTLEQCMKECSDEKQR